MKITKSILVCFAAAVALVESGPVWAQLIYTDRVLVGDHTSGIQSAMTRLVRAQALPESDPDKKEDAVKWALLSLAQSFGSADGLSNSATGNITPQAIHERITNILKHYGQEGIQEYGGEVLGALAAQDATPNVRRLQIENDLFKLIGAPNRRGASDGSNVMSWISVLGDMGRVGHLSVGAQKKLIDYLKKTKDDVLKSSVISALKLVKDTSNDIRDAFIGAIKGSGGIVDWGAIEGLARYSDPVATRALINILRNNKDAYSREYAIVSLLGGQRPRGTGYNRREALNNETIRAAIFALADGKADDADTKLAKELKRQYGESQARVAESSGSSGSTNHHD
jgi:hypothetical protein